MNTTSVFVYGSLKPGGSYWDHFCRDRVLKYRPAKISGLLYALETGYPGAVKAETGCWIFGYLLEFENDAILPLLDEFEGFVADQPRNFNEYNRECVPIYLLSGKHFCDAWAYLVDLETVESQSSVFVKNGIWNEAVA